MLEIERARTLNELSVSACFTGVTNMDFETLDSKSARGIAKHINVDFKKREQHSLM